MKLGKCPKCVSGFIEEEEDYSSETHIAKCNKCSSEFWINYKRVYDVKNAELKT